MAQIGADPEQLRALGAQLRRAHQHLESSHKAIEGQLRRSGWTGRDAEAFRTLWSTRHRRWLLTSAEFCRSSAKQLDRQAEDQVRASMGNGTPQSAVVISQQTLPPQQTLGGQLLGTNKAPTTAPKPFADEVLTISLGAEVAAASLLAGSKHQITIQSFGDKREVTISDTDAGGVKLSGGATIQTGIEGKFSAVEAAGSAKATIGQVIRRSYETDEAGMWSTLLRGERDRLVHRTLGGDAPIGPLPGAGQIVGAVVEVFDKRFDLLPDADRTEELAELVLAAKVAASLPVGPSLNGSLSGVLRAGYAFDQTGTRTTTILEAEGAVARSVGVALVGSRSPSTVKSPSAGDNAKLATLRARLELIDTDTQHKLVIREESVTGSTVQRTIHEIDLSGDGGAELSRGINRAVAELKGANPSGAIDALQSIKVPASDISTRSATFSTEATTDRSLGATVGEGITVGGEGNVVVNRMVRQ